LSTTTTPADDRDVRRDSRHAEPKQDERNPEQALGGLADDVRVGEVLHALKRLEAGLHRLRQECQQRRRRYQVEDDGGLVAGVDYVRVGDHGGGKQRREHEPEHDPRTDQRRGRPAVDDDLPDEVVARPEAENDAEHAADRQRRHEHPETGRAEGSRDDERP
jgi:hypothetical protein